MTLSSQLSEASHSNSPLIDIHVHLYESKESGSNAKDSYVIWEYGEDPNVEFSTVSGDLEELSNTYKTGGFDRAVVVHLFDTALARAEAKARLSPKYSREGENLLKANLEIDIAVGQAMIESNKWIAEIGQTDPLIEVMVTVDPTLLTPKELVNHLSDLANKGIVGIKLHPVSQGYLPSDPRLFAIYDVCSDAGLIVLSHSGLGHHGGASARPSEFASVLSQWPNLQLVLAHLGGAAWQEAEELARVYPQVVFDLSEIIEWEGAPNAPSQHDMSTLIKNIGAERVMLGSDFPWYDPSRTVDRVMGLPGLGPGEQAAILGGNATSLLRLD